MNDLETLRYSDRYDWQIYRASNTCLPRCTLDVVVQMVMAYIIPPRVQQARLLSLLGCGELQTTSLVPHHHDTTTSAHPKHTHTTAYCREIHTMASRILRSVATRAPAVSRSFQTSAALRQDAVIAPVRKPVGAFRGG
jgi:hypothetical protein